MLRTHRDELSLEWDKRYEHLQLGRLFTLFYASLFFESGEICCLFHLGLQTGK